MGVLNGIVTLLALLTFIGIVWWAFAKFRIKDNEQAAMLPFALPEDGQEYGEKRGKQYDGQKAGQS